MGNVLPFPYRPVNEFDDMINPNWRRQNAVSFVLFGALVAGWVVPALSHISADELQGRQTYPFASISVPDCKANDLTPKAEQLDITMYPSHAQDKIIKAREAANVYDIDQLALEGCKLIAASGAQDPGVVTMNVSVQSVSISSGTRGADPKISWSWGVTDPSYVKWTGTELEVIEAVTSDSMLGGLQ